MHAETSRPRRVIVVDRDPKVRAIAQGALKPPEFEAYTFESGAAALARVDQIRPDCVVSDALLPDMHCELFLSALRARSGLEAVPAVAMSLARSEARIRAVLDAGFDAYVLKPFPLHELLGKVRSLLPSRRARQANKPEAAPKPRAAPLASPAEPLSLGDALTVALRPAGPAAPSLPRARKAAPPAQPPAAAAGGSAPAARPQPLSKVDSQGGRYTRIERGGRSLVVLTEAKHHPRFVITTVITEKGWALRKISTELPHALARDDDRQLVGQQIDLQHETVLRNLDLLVLESTSRRVVWSRGLVP